MISTKGAVHSLKQFNTVIQVNLIGTFNVLRLAAAAMAKQVCTFDRCQYFSLPAFADVDSCAVW